MHSQSPNFAPPSEETEQRVENLLAQMTLDEKLLLLGGKPGQGGAQANSSVFGVERLGLPDLRMADGPMGVHWWCDASTSYPALLSAAASWDQDLWYELGGALGRDCRARGVHILLAPGVNIYRGPLCGRNFEYGGEDPFLSSAFGVAYVKGVQDQGVCATIKHYAVNFQEYARHTVSSDLDERTLHEIYLPAFKAAVTEGGCGALMTAYNLINGVQCSEHADLINGTLKGDWAFDGLVMSDWLSTYSVADAANAGLDMEMPTALQFTADNLKPLIELGVIEQETIDDKIRRLLRLAVCFGWLDHKQLDKSIPHDDTVTAEVALTVARKGIVLLENRNQLLPLDRKKVSKMAVLGPYAHPAVFGGGGSSFNVPHRATSVLEGMKQVGRGIDVVHASGPDPNPQRGVFTASIFYCEEGQGLKAEYFNNEDLEGEPKVCRVDEQINFSWGIQPPASEITEPQFSVRWTGEVRPERSGTHLFHTRSHDSEYRVWIDGRLIVDTQTVLKNGPHRVDMQLEAGRSYSVRIEFRKTRFFTGMQFGWQFSDGGAREIAECVELARSAEVAVVTVGWDNVSEAEGFDREFEMNPELEKMLLAVSEVQPNTVVVITAGGNLDMSRWGDKVAGVLHAFYPGQAGGHAIAEIVFGLVGPSAKLPFTMERRLEDRSCFGSYHDSSGDSRVSLEDGIFTGYRHFDREGIEPRYPFGHGLSYTEFEYSELKLSRTELGVAQSLSVSVRVTNTGDRRGAEVVQLYVRDPESRLPRPEKELKGFGRVELEPGQSDEVHITLEPSAFEYYDPERGGWLLEPGEFVILVGASSKDIRLEGVITIR